MYGTVHNLTDAAIILIATCFFSTNKYNSEKNFHEYSQGTKKNSVKQDIVMGGLYCMHCVLAKLWDIISNRLAVNLLHWLIKSKSLQGKPSYYVEFHFLKHVDFTEFVNKFLKG